MNDNKTELSFFLRSPCREKKRLLGDFSSRQECNMTGDEIVHDSFYSLSPDRFTCHMSTEVGVFSKRQEAAGASCKATNDTSRRTPHGVQSTCDDAAKVKKSSNLRRRSYSIAIPGLDRER